MEEQNNMENQNEKTTFTREEVENIVRNINVQAGQQCQQLANRCRVLEEQLTYRRIDYLFSVLRYEGNFSPEFVDKCTKEIEEALCPSEEEDKKED